ncbi:hypothetical protein COUCH_37935 [Couchioplanes caeruleus]|uniref:hypothetical protein n=1 Tax=Couchioplanes caeruleus TaxID=56438 RepID=UPI0020BEB2DE|nr:hypothetical protein [Couchioplanes caeruleus]UQU64653.1 hypothetical protein COUCH_37935 [Couchioplanes caeruleus]
MRFHMGVGAALLAASAGILPGTAAFAQTGSVNAAADEADVPDLQEFAVNPDEIDSGQAPDKAPTAVDVAEVGAIVRAPLECEPGYSTYSWTGTKTPWTVTHAKGYENFTGSTATYTKSATRERTITASAEVTSGATVSANVVIASLDGQVSWTLAASGSVTNSGSESVTATMKPGSVYVFYAGARKTSGSFSYSLCNSSGTHVTVKSKGKATSFGLKREGAVRCGSTVTSASLGYVAERDYC